MLSLRSIFSRQNKSFGGHKMLHKLSMTGFLFMATTSVITTNPAKVVLYIGVTNELARRLAQHYKNRSNNDTFVGHYFCYNLVYTEQFIDIKAAISREKELKGWTRAKKNALIADTNPN